MQYNRQRAFTLIELLVVIAIISMLLSIMMPALGRARENGKRVVCMTNLHAIGQSIHIYGNNYNDRLLPGDFSGSWYVWARVTEYSGCAVPPTIEIREVNLGHLIADGILEVPDDKGHVFFCPSSKPVEGVKPYDEFESQWGKTSDDSKAPIGYMFNNALDGYNDCVQTGQWAVLSHGDQVNFLKGDGSAHAFKVRREVYDPSIGPELLQEVSARYGVSFPDVLLHKWFEKGRIDVDQANAFLSDPLAWIQANYDLTYDASGRSVSKSIALADVSSRSLVADRLGVAGSPAPPPAPG